MKKILITKKDLLFFIQLGCSNRELAEVFSCSEKTIANRKVEFGLLNETPNNKTTAIIDGIRKCVKCLKMLPIESFSKQSSASQGVRSTCKECCSIKGRSYNISNRERRKETSKKHYELNKEKYFEKYHKRRAAKEKAVPKWYGELDKFIIEEMYDLCRMKEKMFDIPFEIDHIIPIQNDTVCGLHWHENWQILTRAENRRKSNKLWEQYVSV